MASFLVRNLHLHHIVRLLAALAQLQEFVTFVELFLLVLLQEGTCLQTIPLRHKDLKVDALNILDLKRAEIEQVGHKVTMGEHHAFVAQLIEPRMRKCVNRHYAHAGLVHKQLRKQVKRVNICVVAENLNDKNEQS